MRFDISQYGKSRSISNDKGNEGNFPKIYFDKNTKTNKGFQDGQSS
jgi:hypothetical protein